MFCVGLSKGRGKKRMRGLYVELSKGHGKKCMRVPRASALLAHCGVAMVGAQTLVAQEWPRPGGVPEFVAGLLYRRS